MLLIAVLLFILGLGFGSFVNALVWRLHMQIAGEKTKGKQKTGDLSILKGRSMCPNCRHTLSWHDLIPVLSWISLKGRCRYCRQPISKQYPAVELAMGFIFALSYIFWPSAPHLADQWLLLATWLVCSVGLLALAVYDARWMLLPNKIIYPTLLVAAAGRAAYIGFYEARPLHALAMWALSVAVSSGIFFALFMISKGQWIGYGDVRLGLITGTLLATPAKSFLMIFLASLLGSLAAAPHLFKGQKTLTSRLPYGPFLITATGLMVVFGDNLINWYKNLFSL
jgi:prepilin signal peptidase PulO-like enzyme (type II secretory pathway)